MNLTQRSKLMLMFVAGAFVACDSPILEHANATPPNAENAPATSADAASCPLAFPQHRMCAELTWNEQPNTQGSSSFTLRFWKLGEGSRTGPYVSPSSNVFVKLWMPSMGHGSSPVTTLQAQYSNGQAIPGVYLGRNVYFIMNGSWDIHVQLKRGSQVIEDAIAKVDL